MKQSLTTSPDNRIRFGDTILVRCEGTYYKPASHIAKAEREDCYLSTSQSVAGSNTILATGIPLPIIGDKTALVIQWYECYNSNLKKNNKRDG